MISENVLLFCCEDISKIENYEEAVNDITQTWHCHHRLETHNSDGEKRSVYILKKELLALDMYYHRPADELVFMTCKEHRLLHSKKHDEKSKSKMRNAWKGKKWFNDGKTSVRAVECPEGFVPGRL